ncbi:MAG: response regulator [Arenicella sp.]
MSSRKTEKKYKVLFVDDERRVTTALRSIFRQEYKVFVANSGVDALTLLAENDIDVIVSDQRMPNMLGHQLLAEVQKRHPRTMRILLTGFTDKEAIIRNINEGQVYRFLNKPWQNDEIRRIIAEAALASEFEVQSAIKEVNAEGVSSKKPAIHILEEGDSLQNQIKHFDALNGSKITISDNFEDSLKVIDNSSRIGLFIIQMPKNISETLQTISMLKKARPELLTMVLAKDSDSNVISQLINVGQVFRYFSDPCDSLVLEDSIDMAFRAHLVLKDQKKARMRVKVEQKELVFSDKVKQFFAKFGLNRSEA